MRPPLIIGVKTEDHAVAAVHSVDRARWQESFEGLMPRIAGRFARQASGQACAVTCGHRNV